MPNFNEQWFCPNPLANRRSDKGRGFGLLVKLGIGAGDIRTGEIGFDTIGTTLDSPSGAESEVSGEMVNIPFGLRSSDDGDRKDLVFGQRAASSFNILSPDFG